MSKDPQMTDSEGNPLCFGEEYEEGHDICNDCFAESACQRMYYSNKRIEQEKQAKVSEQLLSIRLPSQPYYPAKSSPSMKSLFDVTSSVTNAPKYIPPSTYSSPSTSYNYSTSITPPTSLTVRNPQDYLETPGVTLMEDPVFPNQFEGESAAVRLIKNSLLAGARMMLYELYRGLESALSRYLWPPSIEVQEATWQNGLTTG